MNGQRVKQYIWAAVNNPREDLFLKDPTWAIKDGQTERLKIKRWLEGNLMEEVVLTFFKH